MNNSLSFCKCLIIGLALYVIPCIRAEWVSIPPEPNQIMAWQSGNSWLWITDGGFPLYYSLGQSGPPQGWNQALSSAYAHDRAGWSAVWSAMALDSYYSNPAPAGVDSLAADSAAVWAVVKAMAMSIAVLGVLLFVTRKLRNL